MSEVLYDVNDRVAVITLNRPEKRNAINRAMREALFEAFARFEASDQQVAILTAAGDSTFCAGMDLVEAAEMGIGVPPPGFLPVLGDNVRTTKPIIAAVNGLALAGGWLFAQMCDLCVASETASFGISEAKVGRGMPWATPLINMIPQRVALELLMTAQPISAARAYEIGFVNHVVPPERLQERAMALARTIASNAPLTVRAAKEAIFLATEMGRCSALRAADRVFESVYRSSDALEGPRAFREKRVPQWTGR